MKKFIKKNLLTKIGTLNTAKIKHDQKFLKKYFPNELSKIYEYGEKLSISNFSQILYHIYYNINSIPKCKCGINLKFNMFKSGYSPSCKKCINVDMPKSQRDKIRTAKHKQSKNAKNKLNSIIPQKHFEKSFLLNLINIQILSRKNFKFTSLSSINMDVEIIESILFYTSRILPIIPINRIKKISDLQINERIYILINSMNNIPKCIFCEKNAKFLNSKIGYDSICKGDKCKKIKFGIVKLNSVERKIDQNLSKINLKRISCYNGHDDIVKIQCAKCGTTFNKLFHSGSLFGDKICPKCYNVSGKSRFEYEIKEFLEKNGFKVIHGHRIYLDKLHYKELDIYVPDKNLAIEFNGLYYHQDNGTNKNYHLNKTKLCESKNIQLIHVFENEWLYKKEMVKSIILAKLGKFDDRIYARKCEIGEIDAKTKTKFLNDNHIQGNDVSKIRLGLFHNSELISIMTFGRRKIGGKSHFELIRFCNKLNTQVIGGASKLFKHFMSNYEFENIVSFADRRFSNGNLYKTLKFDFKHYSTLNYWYFKDENKILFHRVNFQKHKLKDKLKTFDENLSEWENMKNNGWSRIWDCGNFVFEFRNK